MMDIRDLINIIIPWNEEYLKTAFQKVEENPSVGFIPPQPIGLQRCTVISCNSILEHFKKRLITSSGEVPTTAEESFGLLIKRGLKVIPHQEESEARKYTVKSFVQSHQRGVWYLGTIHHAISCINGVIYDSENKGLDNRIIDVIAEITR